MQIEDDKKSDKMFLIRQCLNAIFMLSAIVGVVYYIWFDKITGIYIILVAMAVKMAESTLRMFKH